MPSRTRGGFWRRRLRMEMALRGPRALWACAPKAAIQLRGSLNAETLRAKVGLHVSRFTFHRDALRVSRSKFPANAEPLQQTPTRQSSESSESLERPAGRSAGGARQKQFRGGHRAFAEISR